MKEDETCVASSTHGRDVKCIQNFCQKTEGKILHEGPLHTLEVNNTGKV
jgi:hypothetical protein